MRKIVRKNLPLFQFHLLQKFSDEIEHIVSSRLGGVSEKPYESLNLRFEIGDDEQKVRRNRSTLCATLNIENNTLISANQTHSKDIAVIDHPMAAADFSHDTFQNIDGFVTNIPEVALLVQVADCQAILMFDPVQKVIAAVHAGWKGLVQDISGEAIMIMRKKFGVQPKHLLVGISPSLGPCCSFFSDPEKELPPNFHPFIKRNKCVNLWNFSLEQLQGHGVLPQNIELARVCTFCGAGDKFFSYRRDRGITGRFGAVIFLR